MSPLYTLKDNVCDAHLQSDVDVVLLDKVYWILGDLMIKYDINLMPYWRIFRLKLEDALLQLHIFEVEWCQALLLGPRIGCFVAMLILNAYMIASFLKGMKDSGSVVGTALSSGANFVFSALYGYILWGERFSQTWWIGFSTVMAGVVLLTTAVAAEPKRKSPTRPSSSMLDRTKQPVTTTVYERNEKDEFVPKKLPLKEYIKAVGPKTPPPTPPRAALSPTKILGPSRALLKKHKQMTTPFVDRFYMNECPLCQESLFDEQTGLSSTALANLSPQLSTVYHAKCLIQHCAQMKKSKKEALCVVTNKPITLWTRTKQAASLGAFWIERVERIGNQLGPAQDDKGRDKPLAMDIVRQKLHEDPTLTDDQKEYIDEDPSGLEKGLATCITWGGSVDYNDCAKGHVGYKRFLETEGIWQYDARRDEIWFHSWGLHPKKRCDFCQLIVPLPILCEDTGGSCEALAYCSENCEKSGSKRHKVTREIWLEKGPKVAYTGW